MKKLLASVFSVAMLIAFSNFLAAQEKKPDKEKKPAPSPEERFKQADKNGDGKVTLEEFVGKPKDDESKKKKEEQFKKMDKNGDGSLDIKEFAPPKREGGGKKKP